jgi:hypothetical protein
VSRSARTRAAREGTPVTGCYRLRRAAAGAAGQRTLGHVSDPSRDYQKDLLRLATFLVRHGASAEQVVRDVLESSPPEGRDVAAERQAVVVRCRAILRKRHGLPPS